MENFRNCVIDQENWMQMEKKFFWYKNGDGLENMTK
jgi:hypothetical protein